MDTNGDLKKEMKAVEDQRQICCSGLEGGEKEEEEEEEEEGDNVSPQDFALGIPDIFEKVLGYLNYESFLECRFVSQHWRSVATKVLKKTLINSISFRLPNVPPFVASTHSLRTVQELILFLKETYTLETSPLDLNAFPFNALVFDSCLPLGDPGVQSLLDLYGKHLISFNFCFSLSEAQSEAVLIQQVEHLLGAQAPNLRNLALQLLTLTTEPADIGQSSCITSASASSPKSIEIKLMKNKKLNSLLLEGATRKVIDCIVAMSPNLSEIDLPNCSDYYLLLEPTNILHYLKNWELDSKIIHSPTNNWMNIKDLEAALLSPSPKERRQVPNLTPTVQCLELEISFEDGLVGYFRSNEDVRLSFVRILNNLLESSWSSLYQIVFIHAEEVLKGIKWPPVMPQVKLIFSKPKGPSCCGLEIFPWGDTNFKFQKTFPNIKVLTFNVAVEYIMNSSEEDFLRKSKLGPIYVEYVNARILADNDDRLVHLANMGGEERLVEYYSENLLNKLFTYGRLQWRIQRGG